MMHAQDKARGLKAGDNYAVPLCADHHRTGRAAVHRAGDERSWWASLKIDPIAYAHRLWATFHVARNY